jgi:hypothetical protein
MRRPLVIYDFAPDPFEFPYIWGKIFFIFFQCTTLHSDFLLSVGSPNGLPEHPWPPFGQSPAVQAQPVCRSPSTRRRKEEEAENFHKKLLYTKGNERFTKQRLSAVQPFLNNSKSQKKLRSTFKNWKRSNSIVHKFMRNGLLIK